jgi:hypothetical protein
VVLGAVVEGEAGADGVRAAGAGASCRRERRFVVSTGSMDDM